VDVDPWRVMSEQDKTSGHRWRAALNERDVARVERACAGDADLAEDLEALLAGLSTKRRAPFLRQFAANLSESESPQTALLLALSDIRRTAVETEGGEVTGSGDTPPGQIKP
jgi:hypothetical protein